MSEPQKTNSEPVKFKWGGGNENRPIWGSTITSWGKAVAEKRAEKQNAPEPPKPAQPLQIQPLQVQQKEITAPLVKLNWTKEEDEALTYYIEVLGANNWNAISSNMKG